MSAPEPIHESVLLGEAMSYLNVRPGRLYCDATLGGAGHSARILELSKPDGRLISIDRDLAAIERARVGLGEPQRVTLVHGDFGNLGKLLGQVGVERVDGILVDLGISSDQLADQTRGFSFSKAGPVDMRMDPTTGATAAELLESLDADSLADILYRYGEERASRRIARAIHRALGSGPIESTTDLAEIVARAAPRRGKIHPATRVFMALRIAVNDELGTLERLLAQVTDLLSPGGRIVVIAFHSLEDRIVKLKFRELSRKSEGNPSLSLLTKKPIWPTDQEVVRNPRARSARLRAAERLA